MVKPCGKKGVDANGEPCLDVDTLRAMVHLMERNQRKETPPVKRDAFQCGPVGPPPLTPRTIRPAFSARERQLPATRESIVREMSSWLAEKQDQMKDMGEAIAYATALEAFVDVKIAERPTLTRAEASDLMPYWQNEFEEATDIPTLMEPLDDDVFATIHDTGQGPVSTTCGVYALFSLMHHMGRLDEVLVERGIFTFGALDRFTADLRLGLNPLGTEGLGPEMLSGLAADGPWQRPVALEDTSPVALDATFNAQCPYGAILLVRHAEGGFHYVHALAVNAAEQSVRYYDPSNYDGANGVREIPLKDFFARFDYCRALVPQS